ncbi:MAG TPA: hypothetical protein VF103_00695 [Polyangiaceae bacterium]
MTLLRGAFVLSVLALGCDNRAATPADAGTTEPSPNASILPAPLATGLEQAQAGPRDAAVADADADAEPITPEWQREDRALPIDLWEPHDLSGLALGARFRWPDVAPPPRLAEANVDAVDRLSQKMRFDATLELAAAGRMRFVLASPNFLLPEGTELRARAESLGHLVVWPNGARYAVVQAGALRALLNERRADTEPLTHAKASAAGEGQNLGFATEKSRFVTSFGRLDLEQARVPGSGTGGALLCRFVLEIAGIHPDSAACAPELVPVRAEYAWASNGRLSFEVTTLQRAAALTPDAFAFPPSSAEYRIGELPAAPRSVLAARADLRAIRNKPSAGAESRDAGAPKEGLLVVNPGDLNGYVLVDGVPVAHVEPRGSDILLDLISGSYALQARDFLATEISVPSVVSVPARVVVSEAPKSEP